MKWALRSRAANRSHWLRSPVVWLIAAGLLLAGKLHTQAAPAGSVVAWGRNDSGQTTVPVAAQSEVTAIVAGGFHTAALKINGSVVAWGDNTYGQATVPVVAQSGVTAIVAGYSHTLALRNDASVVAWGLSYYGQTTVPAAAQSGVTAIAAGNFHSVALKSDGSVVAWGDDRFGQATVPVAAQSGVTAIAAGAWHTVALKTNGSVVAWGYNFNGQTNVPVTAQSGVVSIAAGNAHTLALKNNGSVLAWGRNDSGQTTVPAAAQSGVTAIAAGDSHTVALKQNGGVVAWGRNDSGQTTVPTGLGSVAAISAGSFHTVALAIPAAPTAPTITAQPISLTVNAGQSASFTVQAAGSAPLNYQWRFNGINLPDQTNALLNLTAVTTNQSGGYTVAVFNDSGSVTSAPPAVLTVNALPAMPIDVPSVFNTGVGNNGSVLPDGAIDPHYRLVLNADSDSTNSWIHSSTIYPMSTHEWLANSATSKWIAPQVNTATARAGDYTYRLMVNLNGWDARSAIMTGLWVADDRDNMGRTGISINGLASGAAQAEYFGGYVVFMPFQITNGFVPGLNAVDFRVHNGGGPTGLRVENLHVSAIPLQRLYIQTQPASQTVFAGAAVSFSILAGSTNAIRYQWQHRDTNIVGSPGTELEFAL